MDGRSRRRGKTYEEYYGPERATEIRQKLRAAAQAKSVRTRGKTIEELHGPDKARQIRAKLRASAEIKASQIRGKTLVEIHGPERAADIMSKRTYLPWDERFSPERQAEIRSKISKAHHALGPHTPERRAAIAAGVKLNWVKRKSRG